MEEIIINIAKDYTKIPGGRYIKEGRFSGEEFRKKYLGPAFQRFILSNDNKMVVNLDGGYGYLSCFLEEAFGGLARETRNAKVKEIQIISEEEPSLIEKIQGYIIKGLEGKKGEIKKESIKNSNNKIQRDIIYHITIKEDYKYRITGDIIREGFYGYEINQTGSSIYFEMCPSKAVVIIPHQWIETMVPVEI